MAAVKKTEKVLKLLQVPRLLLTSSSRIEGRHLVNSIKIKRIFLGWQSKSLTLRLIILFLPILFLKSLLVQNTPPRHRQIQLLALLHLKIRFRLAKRTNCCCSLIALNRYLRLDPSKSLLSKKHRWLRLQLLRLVNSNSQPQVP